jgi:hypothetical protein
MVSYIEAVDARDGRPVTYFVNPGGVVDSKALQEVVAFLAMRGMEVAGAVLDRGFCTPDVVRALRELHMEFVIALPHDTAGYKDALSELAGDVRWDTAHLVSEDGVFGATREGRIWGKHRDEAFVSLYFDGRGAAHKSVKLIRKVCDAKRRAEAALALGRQPTVEKGLRKYLSFGTDESGRVASVAYDHGAWDAALAAKGFFALISSSDMGARGAYDTYRLRDASETEFSIPRSQEGLDVARVHGTPSIRSKLAVGFLASLLRFEVRAACKSLGLDTNRMIRKVGRIHLMLSGSGVYTVERQIDTIDFGQIN